MTTNDKYDPNKQTCASWDCKSLTRPGYSHCDEHLKAVNDSDELDKIFEDMAYSHNFDYGKKAVSLLLAKKDQNCEQRVREAHMQGWHEGRTAANNPQMVYTFTTGIAQLTKEGDK